ISTASHIPPRLAQEDWASTGEVKSFTVELTELGGKQDELIRFFENLNDIRAEIGKEIQREFEEHEKAGLNAEECFEKYFEKWGVQDLDNRNRLFAALRNHAKSYLQAKIQNNDSGETSGANGKLPYWIASDLEGKLESFKKLAAEAERKFKRYSLFDEWRNGEESVSLSKEVLHSVTGKNLNATNHVEVKKEFLRMAIEYLGGRDKFQSLAFDDTGAVERIVGRKGVMEYNILASQINVYIGQYNGQLTNEALNEISNRVGRKFSSVRELELWAKSASPEDAQEALVTLWEAQKNHILKTPIIKNVPSFPTFKTTNEIKEMGRCDLGSLREFEALIKELEGYPFCLKTFNKNLDKLSTPPKSGKHDQKSKANSMSRAARVRLARRLFYYHSDPQEALSQEIEYLRNKLEKARRALNVYVTAKKVRHVSFYAQQLTRLLLHSRSFSDEYTRQASELKRKRLFGNLQMQKLKFGRRRQFSFLFGKFDQYHLFPIMENKNSKDVFRMVLKYGKVKKHSRGGTSVSYLKWKGKKKETKQVTATANIDLGMAFNIGVMFSRRQGRKFLYNGVLGLKTSHQAFSKLGTPNFVIRYDSRGHAKLSAVLAMTKTAFKAHENLQTDSSNLPRFLIGLDRGERKIFAVTVYDYNEKKVVEQLTLGNDFLEKINSLKSQLSQAQSAGSDKATQKRLNSKIRGQVYRA
ncbi:MAG: hypothetical protein N2578_08310, partial [Bdellovibrionaceae bacterium]|nr:hypothetical protein [Pseudobdellovibrionaceae bacterium]